MKKKKSFIAVIAVVLAAAAVVGIAIGQKEYYKASDKIISAGLSKKLNSYTTPVKFIAHRGFSGLAPENTLAAVKAAGDADYYGCEFDIRLTADGRWVVIHDNDLARMTDGEGLVSETSYADIKKLTIDAGENVIQHSSEKIPSLEEMLDACKDNGVIPFIEIKLEDAQTPDYPALAAVIREKGFENCYIISFKEDSLIQLKKNLPTAEYWLLVSKMTTEIIASAVSAGIDGIDFDASKPMNFRYADDAAEEGLMLGAWTVDNIRLTDKLISKGIFYITTNKITPV